MSPCPRKGEKWGEIKGTGYPKLWQGSKLRYWVSLPIQTQGRERQNPEGQFLRPRDLRKEEKARSLGRLRYREGKSRGGKSNETIEGLNNGAKPRGRRGAHIRKGGEGGKEKKEGGEKGKRSERGEGLKTSRGNKCRSESAGFKVARNTRKKKAREKRGREMGIRLTSTYKGDIASPE